MDSLLSQRPQTSVALHGDSTKPDSQSLVEKNSQRTEVNQNGQDPKPDVVSQPPSRPIGDPPISPRPTNRPIFKMKRTGHYGPSPFAFSKPSASSSSHPTSSTNTPKPTPPNPSTHHRYSLEAFPTGPRVSSDIVQNSAAPASSGVRPKVNSLRNVVRPPHAERHIPKE